jgi:ABC-type siderophore export system fused ATPase/permease subunit
VIELRPDGRWYRDGEPVSDEQAEAYRQAFGRSIVDLLGRDEPG